MLFKFFIPILYRRKSELCVIYEFPLNFNESIQFFKIKWYNPSFGVQNIKNVYFSL